MKIKTREKGFTLLEMLIVVAIVGILVSIALPRYYHSVQKAHKNTCRANQKIARNMLEVYAFRHNDKYPQDQTAFENFSDSSSYFQATPRCSLAKEYYIYSTSAGQDTYTIECPNDPLHNLP